MNNTDRAEAGKKHTPTGVTAYIARREAAEKVRKTREAKAQAKGE